MKEVPKKGMKFGPNYQIHVLWSDFCAIRFVVKRPTTFLK